MTKNSYWAKREKAERLWQEQQDKDLDKYIQHLGEMYQKTIDNINREIKADVGIANGHLIKADKMSEYERLAKDMVKKADAMRAKGHTVTRKDFSKDVNDRLKIYNATMRVNRNEILKSMIGEQLVDLGIEQEVDLTKKLWNDYTKEKKRQAGILGVTTKNKTWSNTDTAEIIYGQIANANFSKRIWANVDSLKGRLDGLVSTAIIRGDNPKEMAKWLTGEVGATIKNQKYVAERLARSETARVQFSVQKMSALQNGYKYVKWYAEGSACKNCKAIAGDDVGYGDGIYPVKEVPDIPVHPNCMCSISAYWIEDDKKNDLSNPEDEINHNKESAKGLNDFAATIKTKGLKSDIISMITDAFNNVDSKVKIPKLDNIEAVTGKSTIGKLVFPNGGIASYNYMNNTLYLNSTQMKSLKNLQTIIQQEKKAEKDLLSNIKKLSGAQKQAADTLNISKRTNVDPSPRGIITHELGHAIQYKDFIKTATKDEKSYAQGDWAKKAAKVSYYATTDPMEYFAESFVAFLNGETKLIDPKLLQYFKKISTK